MCCKMLNLRQLQRVWLIAPLILITSLFLLWELNMLECKIDKKEKRGGGVSNECVREYIIKYGRFACSFFALLVAIELGDHVQGCPSV